MPINSKCPCSEYFFNLQNVDLVLNVVPINTVLSYRFVSPRPFIPIAIMNRTLVGSAEQYVIDLVNTKAFTNLHPALLRDCMEASYNYLDDIILNVPKYEAGNNPVYLSNRVSVKSTPLKTSRYYQPSSIVKNFWDNYTGTLQDLYNKDYETFLTLLKSKCDKTFFVADGQYYISDIGSESKPILDAIVAATGNATTYLQVLELSSIG
jgi:hypothetical protein